jgi:hypothetical protein
MTAKIRSALDRILFDRIAGSSNNPAFKPIVLFDTSTIIELEGDQGSNAPGFLAVLHGKGFGIHFPELVLREIALHNENYKRSGRPEIREATTEMIGNVNNHFGVSYHKDGDGSFVNGCGSRFVNDKYVCTCTAPYCMGGLRYLVNGAIHEFSLEQGGESAIGIISRTDKQLVEAAYLVGVKQYEIGLSRPIRVISLDNHVLGPIKHIANKKPVFHEKLDVNAIHGGR